LINIKVGEIMDYVKILKTLGDHSRMKILASLKREPMYQELLAERLKLNPSTVSFHLKKLEEQGIVTSKKEQYYKVYYINKSLLNINLMKIVNDIELDETEEEREQSYEKQILDTFFKDGRLVSIPVQRKKREVILKELASKFDMDKEYTEKEVNHILIDYHDDFCTLRREFIINKLFTRNDMIYKRTQKNEL
jgi:predicted transcriptional regulator